jgi:hypothetical protein
MNRFYRMGCTLLRLDGFVHSGTRRIRGASSFYPYFVPTAHYKVVI